MRAIGTEYNQQCIFKNISIITFDYMPYLTARVAYKFIFILPMSCPYGTFPVP